MAIDKINPNRAVGERALDPSITREEEASTKPKVDGQNAANTDDMKPAEQAAWLDKSTPLAAPDIKLARAALPVSQAEATSNATHARELFAPLAELLVPPEVAPAEAFALPASEQRFAAAGVELLQTSLQGAVWMKRVIDEERVFSSLANQDVRAEFSRAVALAEVSTNRKKETLTTLNPSIPSDRLLVLRRHAESIARAYFQAPSKTTLALPAETSNGEDPDPITLAIALAHELPEGVLADLPLEMPSPSLVAEEQAMMSLSAPVGGVADEVFAASSTDVIALATMVMMEGAKQQETQLRDMLRELDGQNRDKAKLRQLKSQAQQDRASIDAALRYEFHSLQAEEKVHASVKYEDYAGWRSIAYSGVMRNADGTVYLPSASLLAPPSNLPEWLRRGDAKARSKEVPPAPDNMTLGHQYGLSPQLIQQLRELHRVQLEQGVKVASFTEWLNYPVSLSTVTYQEEVAVNEAAVSKFIDIEKRDLTRTFPYPDEIKGKVLQPHQELMTEYAELLATREVFPELVSAERVEKLRIDLQKLTHYDEKFAPEDAEATVRWRDETLAEQVNEYKQALRLEKQRMATPANYTANIEKCVFHDASGDLNKAAALDKGNWLEVGRHLSNSNNYDKNASPNWSHPSPSDMQISMGAGGSPRLVASRKVEVGMVNPLDRSTRSWTITYDYNAPKDSDLAVLSKLARYTKTADDEKRSLASSGPPFIAGRWPAEFQMTNLGESKNAAKSEERNTTVKEVSAILDLVATTAKNTQIRSSGYPSISTQVQAPPVSNARGVGAQMLDALSSQLRERGTFAMYEARMKEIDDQLDSLGELSEMSQLRLQRYMDARAKMFDTLSNMLKNQANLSRTLTENVK